MLERKVIKRSSRLVDEGTMGFHDYTTKWESMEEFTERVVNEVNKIEADRKLRYHSLHFCADGNGKTNAAIIIYNNRDTEPTYCLL